MKLLDNINDVSWEKVCVNNKQSFSNMSNNEMVAVCSYCGYQMILAGNETEYELVSELAIKSPLIVPFEFVSKNKSSAYEKLNRTRGEKLPLKCSYSVKEYKSEKPNRYRLSGAFKFELSARFKGVFPALKGKCPCCGQKYDGMPKERIEQLCERDYSKIIKKYKSKIKDEKVEIDIADFNFKEYIGTLVELHKDAYKLEKQIKNLIEKKYECKRVSLKAKGQYLLKNKNDYPKEYREQKERLLEITEAIDTGITLSPKEKDKEWKNYLEENAEWKIINSKFKKPQLPVMPKGLWIPIPQKPEPFVFDISRLTKPVEPVYASGNVFTKRKVEKQNAEIKRIYENELNEYNKALEEYNNLQLEYAEKEKEYEVKCKIYNEKKAAYEESVIQYKSEMEKYQQKMVAYNAREEKKRGFLKRETETKECVFELALQEKKNRLADEKKKIQGYLDEYDKRHVSKLSAEVEVLPEVISVATAELVIDDELKTMTEDLFNLYGAIDELYSLNIIYDKYRQFHTLCVFYEYFLSERVSELIGPHGAYNLYEKELKTDKILDKLDKIDDKIETIISRLDDFKDSQTVLYKTMKEINTGVGEINKSMNKLVEEIVAMPSKKSVGSKGASFTVSGSINSSSTLPSNNPSVVLPSYKTSVAHLPAYHRYSSLMSNQHIMIGQTVKKASVIKRGILGGILAGPAGAVVGALSAIQSNKRY